MLAKSWWCPLHVTNDCFPQGPSAMPHPRMKAWCRNCAGAGNRRSSYEQVPREQPFTSPRTSAMNVLDSLGGHQSDETTTLPAAWFSSAAELPQSPQPGGIGAGSRELLRHRFVEGVRIVAQPSPSFSHLLRSSRVDPGLKVGSTSRGRSR
jgi:hypothetical protein